MEEPIKAVENRRPDGTFGPSNNANPAGRPKGKTLKEWVKDKLMRMTDEEREEFLKYIPKEIHWRMAEGNPITKVSGDPENPLILQVINYGESNNNPLPIPAPAIPAPIIEESGPIQDSGVAQEVGKEQDSVKPADSENSVKEGDILLHTPDLPPSQTSDLGQPDQTAPANGSGEQKE